MMNMTVVFEEMTDVRDFVTAWAPVFDLGNQTAVKTEVPAQAAPATPPSAPVVPVVQQPPTPAAPIAPTQPPVTPQAPVTPPQQPVAPAAIPSPAPVPTTTVTYSLDDLARAAMALMDTGRQGELQQLLAKFGVQSLPELPRPQYGAFATDLRAMGAQI